MSVTIEEISAEQLAEMFGEDLGKCQGGMGFGFGRFGFPVWWCKKPATRVILFTCPACGTNRKRLCEACFAYFRRPMFNRAIRCGKCRRRGQWKDAG